MNRWENRCWRDESWAWKRRAESRRGKGEGFAKDAGGSDDSSDRIDRSSSDDKKIGCKRYRLTSRREAIGRGAVVRSSAAPRGERAPSGRRILSYPSPNPTFCNQTDASEQTSAGVTAMKRLHRRFRNHCPSVPRTSIFFQAAEADGSAAPRRITQTAPATATTAAIADPMAVRNHDWASRTTFT